MDHVEVDLECYLGEPDELEDDTLYVEPEGMVFTALHELGARLVAVEPQIPEPA
jgi:hypothetical protein